MTSIDSLKSALGPTRYRWVPEVSQVVHKVELEFPQVKCNTYVCHPWCGWGRLSVDVWNSRGRGDPLDEQLAREVLRFLFNLRGRPFIRHYILDHDLWTSFGGASYWAPDDHTGNLRHVHVTYWPVGA